MALGPIRAANVRRADGAVALVDDMLARYVDWRQDATAAADAFRRWSVAPTDERMMWYSAYAAALEQEESSARAYACTVEDVQRELLGSEDQPAATSDRSDEL